MDLNLKQLRNKFYQKLKLSFTKRIETLRKTTKSNNIKIKQIYQKTKKTLLMYLITEKKYLIEGIKY